MGITDVAVPMGVLITAAVFLAGAFSARAESVLQRLPAALAALLDWSRRPPGERDTVGELSADDHRVPTLDAGFVVAVAVVLLAANTAVAGSGLLADDVQPLTVLVVVTHLLVHLLVVVWTLSEVRSATRRYRALKATSAPALLLSTLAFTVPPRGTPGRRLRTREHVARVQRAVDAVPPGVTDGAYRSQLAEAHVELAEVLLDDGLPREALVELSAADAQPWAPGWLAQRGAHDTEEWLDGGEATRRWALRARAHRDTGDWSAALDDLVEAARQGGIGTVEYVDLVEAGRRSGRLEVLRALVADTPGDAQPPWRDDVRRGMRRALDSDHDLLTALVDPGLPLAELRLLMALEPSDRNRTWLAASLLENAGSAPPEGREAFLAEVADLLAEDLSEGPWRREWYRAVARLHELDGETDAVVELVVDELLHDATIGSQAWAAQVAVRLDAVERVGSALDAAAREPVDRADPLARRAHRRAVSAAEDFAAAVAALGDEPSASRPPDGGDGGTG